MNVLIQNRKTEMLYINVPLVIRPNCILFVFTDGRYSSADIPAHTVSSQTILRIKIVKLMPRINRPLLVADPGFPSVTYLGVGFRISLGSQNDSLSKFPKNIMKLRKAVFLDHSLVISP